VGRLGLGLVLGLGLGLALGLQLGIEIGFRRNHSWSSTFTPRRNHSLCLSENIALRMDRVRMHARSIFQNFDRAFIYLRSYLRKGVLHIK